jgi:hypothetical protein
MPIAMSTTMADLPDLTLDTIWAILQETLPDETVHALVWWHLGYRPEEAGQPWPATAAVSAAWAEKYPVAPHFIDSRPATVQLTRSIAPEHKQLLKEYLGFKGYSVDQLVPRLTRRATMANWLLSVMASQGNLPDKA